jgi:hypothetical protein
MLDPPPASLAHLHVAGNGTHAFVVYAIGNDSFIRRYAYATGTFDADSIVHASSDGYATLDVAATPTRVMVAIATLPHTTTVPDVRAAYLAVALPADLSSTTTKTIATLTTANSEEIAYVIRASVTDRMIAIGTPVGEIWPVAYFRHDGTMRIRVAGLDAMGDVVGTGTATGGAVPLLVRTNGSGGVIPSVDVAGVFRWNAFGTVPTLSLGSNAVTGTGGVADGNGRWDVVHASGRWVAAYVLDDLDDEDQLVVDLVGGAFAREPINGPSTRTITRVFVASRGDGALVAVSGGTAPPETLTLGCP